MDLQDISKLCVSLFNLKEFSVLEACESVLAGQSHDGIIPISVRHEDGTVEVLNKTQSEKKLEQEERNRKMREQQASRRNKKKKAEIEPIVDDTEIDLFGDSEKDSH